MDKRNAQPITKFYVYDDRYINFTCDKCGYSKTIDLFKFKKITAEMRIKCKCSQIVRCQIEFRKKYRRTVKLSGSCRDTKTNTVFPVRIVDLSLEGIHLACLMKSNIKSDDILETTFRLDDSKRTEIKLKGQVKWVRNREVGLKFLYADGFQKDLGFYLMK